MAGRLLIIGLDAGTFDSLDPLVAAGEMPALARLLERGASAELLSTFPPTTSPAWPALVTGLGPGKLGFFGLLNRRPSTQYDFVVARNTFDRRSLWSMAGHGGIRAVACGVPATFPPAESPNVTIVTGMLTPNGQPRTVPVELEAEITRAGHLIDWEELRDCRGSVELADDEGNLAHFMMGREDWRVFVTVFRSSDGIFHTHPAESDAHREMFRRIDAQIAAMVERLDAEDTVMLVSDHGMTRLREVVHVNALFWREGLLTRRDSDTSTEDRALDLIDRIKHGRLFDNALVKNPITRAAAERLRQRRATRTLEFGREGRRQPRLSEALVDWSATECFFVDLGYGSGVYLNLQGREPFGRVAPEAYEATLGRVASILEAQEGVVVRRREEVYKGPYVDRAPDLLVSTSREELGLSGRLLDTPVRTEVDVPYFHHTQRGIWVVAGPGVLAGRRSEPCEIVDVCPTALHLLGLGVPSDADGCVRLELFGEDSEPAQRAVRLVDIEGGAEAAVDEYDDESIKEKLRGLGYMH